VSVETPIRPYPAPAEPVPFAPVQQTGPEPIYVEAPKPGAFDWVKETRREAFGYDEDLDDFHQLGMDVFPMRPTKKVRLSWLKFLAGLAVLGIVAIGAVGYLTHVWGDLEPLGPLIGTGTPEAEAIPTPTPVAPVAPAEPVDVQIATTNTGSNMRADATENSAIIGFMPTGTQVEVTGDPVNGWIPIHYDDQAGYVWGGLVDLSVIQVVPGEDGAVTVGDDPVVEGEEPEFDPEFEAIPAHIRNGTNLRPEPNINNQPLRVMPRGAEIVVIGEEQNGWVPIEFEGQRGYVASQNVDFTPPAADD